MEDLPTAMCGGVLPALSSFSRVQAVSLGWHQWGSGSQGVSVAVSGCW